MEVEAARMNRSLLSIELIAVAVVSAISESVCFLKLYHVDG